MRGSFLVAAAVTGCAYHGPQVTADAGVDGEPPRPDAPPGVIDWLVQSNADFATTAPSSVAIVRNGIEPFAYCYGGLRMRGSNTQLITDATMVTWDTIEATGVQSGTALGTLPLFDQRLPGGVGLDADTTWTLWADGEIYLESGGQHSLSLTADDAGFLDLDVDQDGVFTRIVERSNGNFPTTSANVTQSVVTSGWYPVRVAMSQGTAGGATFFLDDDPPGSEPRLPIERWRYRTRINDLSGLYQIAFDGRFDTIPVATDLYTADAISENWGAGVPVDLAVSDPETFSIRWVGQVYAATAGSWVFTADTDDGHRVFFDGMLAVNNWTDSGALIGTSLAIPVTRGWHDLVFETVEGVGGARASLRLAVDGGAAAAIPASWLRPATGRKERIATATRLINANHETPTTFNFDTMIDLYVFAGTTSGNATAVETAFTATHTAWDEVLVQLTPIAPATTQLLYDVGVDSSPDTQTHDLSLTAGGSTWPVNGRWRFSYSDSTGGTSGSAQMAALTVHYDGGEATIAESSVWTSMVHDYGRSVQIDTVMFMADTPIGAAANVLIRACTMMNCSDAPAFVSVPTSGANPGVPAGQYAQLQVVFTSDGDASPWLDWIDVYAR